MTTPTTPPETCPKCGSEEIGTLLGEKRRWICGSCLRHNDVFQQETECELRQTVERVEMERDLLAETLENFDGDFANFPAVHILSGLTKWCDDNNQTWWSLLPDGTGYPTALAAIRAAIAALSPETPDDDGKSGMCNLADQALAEYHEERDKDGND